MEVCVGKDWAVIWNLDGFNIKRYESVKVGLENGDSYLFSGIESDTKVEDGRHIKTALIGFSKPQNLEEKIGFEIILLRAGSRFIFNILDQKTGKKISEHCSESIVAAIMVR